MGSTWGSAYVGKLQLMVAHMLLPHHENLQFNVQEITFPLK